MAGVLQGYSKAAIFNPLENRLVYYLERVKSEVTADVK